MVSKKKAGKELLNEFEFMRLKALSNVSQKRPLTASEYETTMGLAKYFNIRGGATPRNLPTTRKRRYQKTMLALGQL